MERVEVVELLADGTCPDCGQNYEKGVPPRPVHVKDDQPPFACVPWCPACADTNNN